MQSRGLCIDPAGCVQGPLTFLQAPQSYVFGQCRIHEVYTLFVSQ